MQFPYYIFLVRSPRLARSASNERWNVPIALPNIYCTPQDIYEQIGIDAAQLRLDDNNQASGQSVAATADAIVGATSISVATLQYPMLRGTQLVFTNAQMANPVQVTMTSPSAANATSISVAALTTQVNGGATATDDGVNVWLAGLMVKATKIGTTKVKLYCCGRYQDSDLISSWSVNQWATMVACRWLGTRLYRAAPDQIEKAYQEAIEELKAVQASELNIEDIGTRTSGWPFFSNVSVDLGYTYRKVRVEAVISEPTVTQYPQAVDWNSVFYIEW